MAWENGCDSFSMPTRASRALVKGEKIILKRSLFTFLKNNYTNFNTLLLYLASLTNISQTQFSIFV
jgi:hypothetical protein